MPEQKLSQSCILCSMAKGKDPSSSVRSIKKKFFLISTSISLMIYFSYISLIASWDILCSDHLNLKIKITIGEHKKIICDPSEIFKKIS